MPRLASFLIGKMPNGLVYDDAAQLCLRLHCVSYPGLPNFREPLTKEYLSVTFAALSRKGWVLGPYLTAALYGANFHAVTDKGHWIEVIASIFKRGKDVINIDRGTDLVRMIGVDHAGPAGK